MSIRTVYEYTDADKGFYSVERAGFVTVSDMVFRLVADMQNHGFNVVTTRFTNDTVTPTVQDYTNVWPPSIRDFKLVSKGSGYSSGDRLMLPGGVYNTPFVITVGTPDTAGGINYVSSTSKGYTYTSPAEYNSIVGIPQPAYLVHATADGQPNVDYRAGEFWINESITSTKGGTATANTAARAGSGIPSDERSTNDWTAAWGVNGSGGAKGTRWPTNKIWYWTTSSSTAGRIGGTGTIKKGQEVFDPSGLATIPSGTTIVNTGTFNIPTGVMLLSTGYMETTASATWLELSANVTISGNTTLYTRGNGAAFTSNTTVSPKKFTVALEASGMVDPKNDQVGVYANVVGGTTNTTSLTVDGLTTPGQSWKPIIYAGQRVTSSILPGSVSGYVTVVSANVNSTNTQANIVLSSNQSLTAGETLHFKFEETEPWRLGIEVSDPQIVSIYAATPIQIDNDANISTVRLYDGTAIDRSGAMGAAPTFASGTTVIPDPEKTTEGFLNRKARVLTDGNAYPLNYTLTITNRGVFFGSWEGSFSVLQRASRLSTDNYFNWFLVQRPVDRVTGKTLTTGKSPVFCINSVGYRYWQFIVRETDVLHPSQGDAGARRIYFNQDTNVITTSELSPYRIPADAHWKDSFAVINSSNQISLTEDSKYLVSFLHNLTTPRFRYSEELDIIGQTSADVCMASNEVSITAYQESTQRVYKALPANNPYNSGLRIAVLKKP